MPEIFGTSYVLPAIIVVVLLLILALALLSIRRRRASAPVSELRKVPDLPSSAQQTNTGAELAPAAATAPAAEPMLPTAQDAEVAEATVRETQDQEFDEPSTMEPMPGLATDVLESNDDFGQGTPEPIPSAPSPEQSGAPMAPATRPASNPIMPVILTMLEGWGELSDEDLQRLSVFRSEKLIDTLETLQLPKDLEHDEDMGYRLQQMSLYAAELQSEAAAAEATTHETGGDRAPALGQAAMQTDAAPSTDMQIPNAVDETGGQGATQGEAQPPAAADLAGASFYEADEATAIEETAEAQRAWKSTATESEKPPANEPPPALTGQPAARPAALPWSEEVEASSDSETVEKPSLDAYAGAASAAAARIAAVRAKSDGSSPGTSALGPHAPSESSETAAPMGERLHAGADDLDDTIETVPVPRRALGDFVRTADDLLALPPEERIEMAAFLQPAELTQVLRRTDDPELKKAVIDTLENIGKPSSLEVLRECMEDDNEEVRIRARLAADRIMRL